MEVGGLKFALEMSEDGPAYGRTPRRPSPPPLYSSSRRDPSGFAPLEEPDASPTRSSPLAAAASLADLAYDPGDARLGLKVPPASDTPYPPMRGGAPQVGTVRGGGGGRCRRRHRRTRPLKRRRRRPASRPRTSLWAACPAPRPRTSSARRPSGSAAFAAVDRALQ